MLLGLLALAGIARQIEPQARQEWLWESWRFVKQIFPLLVVGVFIVGVLRALIRPKWIEALAGTNSLLGNLGAALGALALVLYLLNRGNLRRAPRSAGASH